MKKYFILIIFTFITNIASAQNAENPVMQFDEAVSALARDIHAKLAEKRAERIIIGQFAFQDNVPPFSAYWVNQLTGELTNTRGRNYTIHSGSVSNADWIITGEIVQVTNIVRIYTTLTRMSDRAIEASFRSSFPRDEYISDMISHSGTGNTASSAGRDTRETDSWDAPVIYTIGTSPSVAVMNRTITEGDEDFFLLVPDSDGRLTAETTGNTDTFMYLYNYDTGDEIASNDDGGQGTNARIVSNIRAGVRYLAVVRGFSSSSVGAYGFRAFLTVRENASSWDNPISCEIGDGEDNAVVVNRTLQQGDEDYFLLIPEKDSRLTIETTGRTDTYIELYDAERELLDENDDGGQNLNARIRYNVIAGNRYIALVRGYNQNVTGSYGFRAFFPGTNILLPDEYEPNDEPSMATPFQIGSIQNHTFHSGNDVDWIVFQAERAGRYRIHTRGVNNNRLDTYIELYDSNINLIAEDDDGGDALSSRLSVNLNSGTYYLKVWCLDEEPDQGYTISITVE